MEMQNHVRVPTNTCTCIKLASLWWLFCSFLMSKKPTKKSCHVRIDTRTRRDASQIGMPPLEENIFRLLLKTSVSPRRIHTQATGHGACLKVDWANQRRHLVWVKALLAQRLLPFSDGRNWRRGELFNKERRGHFVLPFLKDIFSMADMSECPFCSRYLFCHLVGANVARAHSIQKFLCIASS